jgi:ubiquinone/menaquinone biosynthesis C-methylase UbiE
VRPVDYDERLHAVYAKGRSMSPRELNGWLASFEQYLPSRRPLALLDLGAGIGRLTPALAKTFGGPVTGVEPSAKMREQAETNAAHPGVTYLAGSAESIPMPTASVDGALVYFVWHHVTDKAAGARELHRVVRPGGRVLVRTNCSDRMPSVWWYRWFPRSAEIDRQMYRPLDAVINDFGGAGWSFVTLDEVETTSAASMHEDYERLKTRSLSTFEHLSEDEIADGFAAIEEALKQVADDTPVTSRSDLLVFER